MRNLLAFVFLLAMGCSGKGHYPEAQDALDAGRNYLQACLDGDFDKAAFYAKADTAESRNLQDKEKAYRLLDKEGRQQLRTASLIILELKDLGPDKQGIRYSFSYDNKPQYLEVTRTGKLWRVQAAHTPEQ